MTQQSPLILSVLVCTFLLTGCATDEAARYYSNERYAATPVREVEVLYDSPTRPHEVIADFQARNASVNHMRRQAAQVGAEAVIIGTYGGFRSHNEKWAGENRHSGSYSRITATAIRYTGR